MGYVCCGYCRASHIVRCERRIYRRNSYYYCSEVLFSVSFSYTITSSLSSSSSSSYLTYYIYYYDGPMPVWVHWCFGVCGLCAVIYKKETELQRSKRRSRVGGPETLRASNRPCTHARMTVVAVVLAAVGGCGAVERKKKGLLYSLYRYLYIHTGRIVFLDRLNGPQERHDKMPTTSIRYSMYAYIMCTNTTVR